MKTREKTITRKIDGIEFSFTLTSIPAALYDGTHYSYKWCWGVVGDSVGSYGSKDTVKKMLPYIVKAKKSEN